MTEPRKPPVHPSKLTGEDRAAWVAAQAAAARLDVLRQSAPGDVVRVEADYGDAYSLAVRGKVLRAPRRESKGVEIVLTVEQRYATAVGWTIVGRARWADGSLRYDAPCSIWLAGNVRTMRIGHLWDNGGMGDAWFVGHEGAVLRAAKSEAGPPIPNGCSTRF